MHGSSKKITHEHNGYKATLTLDHRDKIVEREESGLVPRQKWSYEYDEAGRLTRVLRNGVLEESYGYNRAGQRVHQKRAAPLAALTDGQLIYDPAGRLLAAGEMHFAYDAHGRLVAMSRGNRITQFQYGQDTRLEKAILADGRQLSWLYGQGEPAITPVKKLLIQRPVISYLWLDSLRLSGYVDHMAGIACTIFRDDRGLPERMRLAPDRDASAKVTAGDDTGDWLHQAAAHNRSERIQAMLAGKSRDFLCCCDQAGSLRALADPDGRLVKELRYDSFGLLCQDSLPDLFVPIGFAGGLADRDTGLTRFGWRDYQPETGRFTAPDPMGDTGGDGDVYEYCYDDPVSLNDPDGLNPVGALARAALPYAGPAFALGSFNAICYGLDKMTEIRTGEPCTKARDTAAKVTPAVAEVVKQIRSVPNIQTPTSGTVAGSVVAIRKIREALDDKKNEERKNLFKP